TNAARLSTPPRNRGAERPVKAMRPDQLAALLAELEGTRFYPLALLQASTGLRPGEACALRWSDLDRGVISVQRSLTTVSGPTLKAPKRQRSVRTVPVPQSVLTELDRWRKTQIEERLAAGPGWRTDWDGLMFTQGSGAPIRPDTYRHAFVEAAEKVDTLGEGW